MNALSDAPLLFVDCQTTGPYSSQGALLEMAWRLRCGGRAIDTFSSLVQLPEGLVISPTVRKLTGLDMTDLAQAISREALATRFLDTLKAADKAVLIIHYARFERPFLADLLESRLPSIYCTHEIARRLLPGLPGLGIASLAGYFGTYLEGRNRAVHHVSATEVIYDGLLHDLKKKEITSFAALDAFLGQPVPPRSGHRRVFRLPRDLRLNLPDRPGVYRFLGPRERVLYVGKAVSLKDRVNSYFRGRKGLSIRHRELLSEAVNVNVTVCLTAVHAVLLECREIKRHDPPCNQSLKVSGRGLAFCDRHFEHVELHWTPATPVGPFPGGWMLERLDALFQALVGDESDAALFPDAVTDADLAQGLLLFRQDMGFDHLYSRRQLLALGIHLLRRGDFSDEEAEEGTADAEVTGHTPVEISKRCQRLLLSTVRYYLRARLLVHLLTAEVAWQEDGRSYRIRLDEYEEIPHDSQNWAGLGVEAYDLARTLLTEILRIKALGITVEIVPPAYGLLRLLLKG